MEKRENLSSRLGFILLAAGSAVGLGNVWRFPFIVGQNGGAAFVVIYLLCLGLLGLPILMVELGTGRGAQRSIAEALRDLAPKSTANLWSRIGIVLACGSFVLMIYYTDVAGWLFKYTADYLTGSMPTSNFAERFGALVNNHGLCMNYVIFLVVISSLTCAIGVVKGVERAMKALMISLFVLMIALALKAATLPGAAEGLSYYLKPDWGPFLKNPTKVIYEALGQAFFTLSLGVGSMTICGSYTSRERSLVTESLWIIVIDTFVAFLSGMIIFPACATYHVEYAAGPGLIFMTLPNVFAQMTGGRLWGGLFFLFLACAALTTIIAVFECLIAAVMEVFKTRRTTASIIVGLVVAVLSTPCVFVDGVLDWEDFAVSQCWLPIGALIQCIFVASSQIGWGWEAFRKEVSTGFGLKLPHNLKFYYQTVIPVVMLVILGIGFRDKFWPSKPAVEPVAEAAPVVEVQPPVSEEVLPAAETTPATPAPATQE